MPAHPASATPNNVTVGSGTVGDAGRISGDTAAGTRHDQPLITFDDDTFELLPEFSKAPPKN